MHRIKENTIIIKCFIAILDAMVIVVSGGAALLARFDFVFSQVPAEHMLAWKSLFPFQIILTVAIFAACRMYRFVWHNVGLHDVVRMFASCALAFAAELILQIVTGYRLPNSVNFIQFSLATFLFIGMRCSVRIFSELTLNWGRRKDMGERIMLIGGGAAGRMLVQEMRSSNKTNGRICCIIDDNPAKHGKYIDGIRIVGGREMIPELVKQEHITQIILAMPAASSQIQSEILSICSGTGCHVRKVPGIYQLVNGEVTMSTVRDIRIEDLLGREPVELDTDALTSFLGGRVVMVTGGGSIGSELCRQIARYAPKMLIIVDIYENNAYEIQQELRRTYGERLDLRVEIASVRDKDKIYELFELYRPELVFHAAAHKHVPLMEHNPAEAVKNNIFGTYHVVRAAEKYGTRKMVMISTDKAVNPTNFMGATKHFCEMIMQSRFDSPTEYCAVRFGNVLGSNGSVVPLFRQQIAEGGPVTVTDKRIIRYFMTIPEASQLVLEAGAMARQGQIFVLDMGKPVKILDLAENLIRLSGLEPYKDIAIVETGLRPGEKLYEELLIAGNDLIATGNKKIFVEQQGELDRDAIMQGLEELDAALLEHRSNEELVALMKRLVPTYRDPETVNAERAAVVANEEHSQQGDVLSR